MTRRRSRTEDGQATVELALGLPIIFIGALLVLQLALVGRDLVMVAHASREAARAAATDPAAGAALDGARAAGGLDPRLLEVDADRRGDRIVVSVHYQSQTELPLVGVLVPDPVLTSTVTVRDERADE